MATMGSITRPLVVVAVFSASGSVCAQGLSPPGAKGTLTVDYLYEHAGQSQGPERQDRWRIKRSVQIEAQLVAGKPASVPTMQPLDAQQLGKIDQQRAQMEKSSKAMAPAMADVQALMARCGDNEACIEREAAKLGFAMSAQPRDMAAMQAAGRETSAVMQQDAAKYQVWSGTSQRGRYTIDETLQHKVADPLCHMKPGLFCTTDLVRKGGGELPAGPSGAAIEVDQRSGRLALRLPVPPGPLPYAQTSTTDQPLPSGKAPPPSTETRPFVLRTTADGRIAPQQPLVVPLPGNGRSASGEQGVALPGAGAEGGKLIVRWRFVAQ